MRRLPMIVLALAAVAPTATANAQVVEACTFDEPSATISVVPSGGLAHLEVVNGIEIWEGSAQCGTATTANTDTIEVHPVYEDQAEISLEGGPFAPGLTDEGDGSSEIEFSFIVIPGLDHDYFEIDIVGTSGPDHISAGSREQDTTARTFGYDALIDLDAASATPDADIVAPQFYLVHLEVLLGGGDDRFSPAGTEPGIPEPYLGGRHIEGGQGDDHIDGSDVGDTWDGSPGFFGGPGHDTLSFAWMSDTCTIFIEADVDYGIGGGTGEIYGCGTGGFEFSGMETLIGHGGVDQFVGYALDEVVFGRGGPDVFVPWGGSDLIYGGGGRDQLIVGNATGDPMRVLLDEGVVFGDGAGVTGKPRFDGIEEIIAEGEGQDRFVGQPQPELRLITAGQEDILDLRTATSGVNLHAGHYPYVGVTEPGLWVDLGTFLGSPFDDRFVGEAAVSPYADYSDVFRGLEGDDVLLGVGGPDQLRGGPGNDRLDGGHGIDTCDGGRGIDVLIDCERL